MTTKCLVDLDADQLELTLTATDDSNCRVDILNELADRYYRQQPEKAFKLLDEATKLAIANDYSAGYVHSQQQVVHIRHLMGDVPAALAHANKVLGQEQFALSKQQENRLRRKIATLYADLGDFTRALTNLHIALKHEIAQQNRESQAQIHVKIGNIYSLSGDSARALEQYQASLEIFQELGNEFYTAVVHNSYCVDYAKLGEYALAAHNGIIARDLFAKIDDSFGVALSESSLGEVAMAKQEFGSATDHFARALQIFADGLKSEDAIEMLETRLNLSHAYMATNRLESAQTEAETVLQQAQETDLRPLARQAHQLLAQIHETASRPWDALHHLKQYVSLNEAIFGEKAQREIQNLKVIHETEQARAELEQQRLLCGQDKAHFERLARIKDEFVHNVTHDIKNPLSIIETSMYMLKERFLAEEPTAQRILDTINRQLNKILTLVEEMLELAKLEAVPELQREEIVLKPWLALLIELVQPLADEKQIAFSISVTPPELTFHGDRQRLGQALENLLANAVKYTRPAGQVTLRARRFEQQLEIRIHDTGIGIPPEALANIFDRFYRVDNNGDDSEGSGLGLNVAKVAVEQHGGAINVASEN